MKGELDSFNYKGSLIVNTGEKFEIQKEGVVVAELTYQDSWEQVSGEPLAPGLLFDIGSFIDSYYE